MLEVILIVGMAVWIWLYAKKIRVGQLRELARTAMKHGRVEGLAAQISAFTREPITAAELSTYAGITAAEFVWSWAEIDPEIIRAAAFSSGDSIRSGFGFAQWLHSHFDTLAPEAKDGFTNRLMGYFGEQHVANLLAAKGHVVQLAETANHPVWDLLIDGHAANVKTVADAGAAKVDAFHHPGVTYIIPEHAHGGAAHNLVHLHGFDHSVLKESLKESIANAHGEIAGHAMGLHLPWITVGFAAYRNIKAVKLGKDPLVAVKHTFVESVGRGAGVVIGGKLGMAGGGLFFGPVGALLGTVIGAVTGAALGGSLAENYKEQDLRKAITNLEGALEAFGRSFSPKLGEIHDLVTAPVKRAETNLALMSKEVENRKRGWRWQLWPDFFTIVLEEASTSGYQKVAEHRRLAKVVIDFIESAQAGVTSGWIKLGTLMANSPEVRTGLGYDPSRVDDIERARSKVFYERRQLNPLFEAPD